MSQTWEMTAVGTGNAAHCLRSKCYIYAVYLSYNGNFLTAVKHAASLPKPDPSPPGPFLPEQTAPTAKTCSSHGMRLWAPRSRPVGSARPELPNRSGRLPAETGIPAFWGFFFQPIRKKKNLTRKLFTMISLKLSLKICQSSCLMVSQ